MATEVANQQVTANATEENTTETKAEETAVVKDEQKSDEATKNNAENHSEAPAAGAPAKVVAPKITVHKADFEKDIIYLYQFSRTPFLPSLSPYCLKVETWLRLAGLKYEVSFLFFQIDFKNLFRKKNRNFFHVCYTIFTFKPAIYYFLNY